jgi:hypothetical protein
MRGEDGRFLKGEPHPWRHKPKVTVVCKTCGKEFLVFPYRLKSGIKLACSISCAKKGRIGSDKQREAVRNTGMFSRRWMIGITPWNKGTKGIMNPWNRGTAKSERSLRKIWANSIKIRDGGECVLSDGTCSGRIEVHHIFPWGKFPSLRFVYANGITLCSKHHPRGIEKEKKLAPLFLALT